jgi:glycosyltransferase involved in cell wall biosynthesis
MVVKEQGVATHRTGAGPDVGPAARRPRVLIFVIAYWAESTLKTVLQRIPERVFKEYACEVLVVDDASEDRTFEIGCAFKGSRPDLPMTVLRNEYNQGYGGNQKVGYAYGIAQGFDFIAMVHGDGQYAPEALPRLLEPLRDGKADAVFGSRMMTRFGALKGGMPLYKYIGNRVLTTIQNLLLGSRLSEFHSGYRIYSTRALERIPYRLNSSDFHFDTEIIIQLLNAGLRIVELPIPTYYGNEICRVNGLQYAWNVLMATVRNTLHRAGLLYQRKLDPLARENTHYDLKLGYPSSHTFALECVPSGARVLDIGAGPGGLARQLTRKGCSVAIVDQFPPPSAIPGVEILVAELDGPFTIDVEAFDYLLLLDVIEHLKSPERFLEQLRRQFGNQPKRVIVSVPNVAFIVQRVMLLFGQFNYGRQGILDRTHTRLFTFRTIRHLLRDHGFRIASMRGVPVPFEKAFGPGRIARLASWLNCILIRLSKTLFAYQVFVEATTTPDVDFVLRDAVAMSAARAARLADHRGNTGAEGTDDDSAAPRPDQATR